MKNLIRNLIQTRVARGRGRTLPENFSNKINVIKIETFVLFKSPTNQPSGKSYKTFWNPIMDFQLVCVNDKYNILKFEFFLFRSIQTWLRTNDLGV